MKLPFLKSLPTRREQVDRFGGYSVREPIPEGQFADEMNLSAREFPALMPRRGRGKIKNFTGEVQGLYADGFAADPAGAIGHVMDDEFYPAGESAGLALPGGGERQVLVLGTRRMVFPDKMIYDVKDKTIWNGKQPVEMVKTLEATFTQLGLSPANYVVEKSSDYPSVSDYADDGVLWEKTNAGGSSELFVYNKGWKPTEKKYFRILYGNYDYSYDMVSLFEKGDLVEISGFQDEYSPPFQMEHMNGVYTVVEAGTHKRKYSDLANPYIIVEGELPKSVTGTFYLKKKFINMDFVTTCNNRVWGCSSERHEIYASMQGDPANWQYFENTTVDSYTATIGTEGDFTGIASIDGTVLFFKESCIHRLMGTMPANFQLQEIRAPGIQRGSHKSAVQWDGVLYYKGVDGVYAYQGGQIACISRDIDAENYTDAVAGIAGDTLYISMREKSSDDNWQLFSYNLKHRVWHREDPIQMRFTAAHNNTLYYLDGADGGLYCIQEHSASFGGAEPEGGVNWMAETWDIWGETPDKARLSKLQIRLSLAKTASIKVEVQYDGGGGWHTLRTIGGGEAEPGCLWGSMNRELLTIPLVPRRCDRLRLKLSGKGDFKLYSITKTYQKGSDE
ncbi:MAG: hypothetical protein FWE80_06170 [Oscillospiraceae bacterium]|nr:hypothetical protein [Oscillospiraceae bacterium]